MKEENIKTRFQLNFTNDSAEILEFCNLQVKEGNFNDAIRYLIQKEISENGIRNLQKVIPEVRDQDYFKMMNGRGVKVIERIIEVNPIQSSMRIKWMLQLQ